MTRNRFTGIAVLILLLPVALLVSCDKFEGSQEVPSYILIDSIGFESNYDFEGTDKQDILDAWVYVNDQTIGGFELPAEIPILQEGPCKIEIRPGIKLNGISATRAPYPYFVPIVYNDVRLTPDSTVKLGGGTTYRVNTEFLWMEDFEDAVLVLVPAPQSDTTVRRTQPANAEGAFIDEHSEYSGIVTLTEENPYMQLQTDDGEGGGFVLDNGDFIFLEMHFKTDVTMIVGMFIKQPSGEIETRPFIGLNATDDWKKVYINFTPVVIDNPGAEYFKVYFEANRSQGETDPVIMFDNLKFISRQNL